VDNDVSSTSIYVVNKAVLSATYLSLRTRLAAAGCYGRVHNSITDEDATIPCHSYHVVDMHCGEPR